MKLVVCESCEAEFSIKHSMDEYYYRVVYCVFCKKFPYSIECKNQESVNVWKSYEQAKENSGDYEPIVVLKRNNTKPLVLVDADYFVRLHNELVD